MLRLPSGASGPKKNQRMKAVRCPTCKKTGDWFAGAFGPFCSRRCKLVDLGKWLNEENKVSEPLRPDHLEEFEHLDGDDLDRPEGER